MGDIKPRKVHVNGVLSKLNRVDTSKEQYEGEVCLELKWRESVFDDYVGGVVDFKSVWDPMVDFENLLVTKKEKASKKLIFNSAKEALVCERRVVEGVFSQPMNLIEFPFDTQTLTVQLQSCRTTNEVVLSAYDPLSVKSTTFLTQEWLPKQDRRAILSVKEGYDDDDGCSKVCFTYKISRKHHFYIYNMLLVLFAITTLTFTTFSVSLPKTQNRLHLSILLILSNIAYRSNLNNSLPKIPYLTKMDKIGLAFFTLQCLICLWHCIISVIIASTPTNTSSQPNNLNLIFPEVYIIENNKSNDSLHTIGDLLKFSPRELLFFSDASLNKTVFQLSVELQLISNYSYTLQGSNICSTTSFRFKEKSRNKKDKIALFDAIFKENSRNKIGETPLFDGLQSLKELDMGAMGVLFLVYLVVLAMFLTQAYNLTVEN